MYTGKLVGLLLICSMAYGVTEIPFPSADRAREQSLRASNERVVTGVSLLTKKVNDAIIDAIKYGLLSTTVQTTDVPDESVHIVNERLRSLGYYCKLYYSHWTGQFDIISWGLDDKTRVGE